MDGTAAETCEECGFDSTRWLVRDVGTFFNALDFWWRHALEGIDPATLNQRPADGVWSALEYGVHSSLVTAVIRAGVEMIRATDGVVLPDLPADDGGPGAPATDLDPAGVLDDLRREGSALGALCHNDNDPKWRHTGTTGGERYEARAMVLHAAHDASHHQMDVARGLAALGTGTPKHDGDVVRVNASDGGVPKRAVPGGAITHTGLDGDRQRNRKHHGRAFQALCLWSQDVLDELAGLGHPIEAGSAGENVTVRGLDWAALRPGARLRIGSALAELSYPAVPCANQTRWFSDGDFSRIAFENNPQWVRWYAWVREPGEVAPGDKVLVQP
jgi:MOSC domain-containing protein YiiM